jgi:hypothetical protein
MNVCVAFDFMRVRVADMKHMSRFTPALTALFESEHPEIADALATEQDKNAVINNTGRKPKGGMDYVNDNRSKQGNSSSDTGSSGEGRSRRQKKEKRMWARKEWNRFKAERQRALHEQEETRGQINERKLEATDAETANGELKHVLVHQHQLSTVDEAERLRSTG